MNAPHSSLACSLPPRTAWLAAARTRRCSLAVIAGLAVGFGVLVVTSHGLQTAGGDRLGGDFPAFWGAGRILNAGDARHLYDDVAQVDAQRGLFPSVEIGWLPFAYPPYVAVAYQPFALLPFTLSYVLYTLAMVACCIGAVRLLSRVAPWCAENQAFWVAAALCFYPLFHGVAGGQNTALSLLCAAGAASALHRGRHAQAGLWLGLWLFKPQLALLVTTLIVVGGYVEILPAFLATAAVLYGVGIVVGGPDWPLWWYGEGVHDFLPANLAIDGHQAASLRELLTRWQHPGLIIPATVVLLAVACALILRYKPTAVSLVGGAVAVALLASPHSMYYDGGLVLISVIAFSRGHLIATGALLFAGFLFVPVYPGTAFSPLPFASLLLCGLGLACLRVDPANAPEPAEARHNTSRPRNWRKERLARA